MNERDTFCSIMCPFFTFLFFLFFCCLHFRESILEAIFTPNHIQTKFVSWLLCFRWEKVCLAMKMIRLCVCVCHQLVILFFHWPNHKPTNAIHAYLHLVIYFVGKNFGKSKLGWWLIIVCACVWRNKWKPWLYLNFLTFLVFWSRFQINMSRVWPFCRWLFRKLC